MTRILFVLDASNSMTRKWEGIEKWQSAKRIMMDLTDSLSQIPNVEIGLRVYGHQSLFTKEDCEDSRLEVTIGVNRGPVIANKLGEIKPLGITPIAYSLENTVHDFPDEPGRNVIILITDGEESCEADPCEVALRLQEEGIILKPFVIGMDIPDHAIAKYECIGTLMNAKNESQFEDNLKIVTNRVLATTTIQIDLLDKYGKATETNANMTLYDIETGLPKYNFYHTLDDAGKPDSLSIDPVYDYNLMVHTIPPIWVEDIIITPNKHNVVKVPAPQGYLQIKMPTTNLKKDLAEKVKAVVKEGGAYPILHIQLLKDKEKYLTGTYDLEILTLPRIKVNGVEIKQSETTTIEVPEPGMVTLNKSFSVYGGIFMYAEDGTLEKIYELKDGSQQEIVALQPGEYMLVYRHQKAKDMHCTYQKPFKVISAESQTIRM